MTRHFTIPLRFLLPGLLLSCAAMAGFGQSGVIFAALAVCGWVCIHLVLTRRLTALGSAARRIVAGDWAARARIAGNDELAQIGQAFDKMAERMSELDAITQDLREQRATEAKLRWKTTFLEAQVNSSIDGILVVDQQGKKILQNRRVGELLRIPQHAVDDHNDEQQLREVTNVMKDPAQFIGRVVYLNSHPDEISRDELELKDGTILDRYSSPVVDDDGEYYGRIWTFRDITVRKQIEEALRQQESELRVLFDFVPAMLCFKDTQNRIVRINQRAAKHFGRSVEEIEGRSFSVVDPRGAESFYAADLEVISTGLPRLGETELARGPGGEELWLQKDRVPVFGRDGKVNGVVVMAQDVTERERTAQSLRLLSSAVEQSKESIMITDADLAQPGPRILFVNPAFTLMTGYTREETVGKTPRILQGPLTDQKVLARLRECLHRGEVFAGEAINYRKDGKEFHMEWQIAPLRDERDKVTHYVAIQHDITERKRLETQLLQSQKLETVGKLAGGIAHEFNSILTAIIGQSELLLTDLPTGSPLARNATEISRAAGRAATLTRQLLAYGRKQTLQPRILDLNTVLSSMESTLRHLLGRDADIRLVLANGLSLVKADASQIEQVIVNLAMNAGEAMSGRGKLTLETGNVALDEEYVRRFPDLRAGEYVMLAVSDTGTGMSEKVKARIFEPFFTTKGIGEGTGLGLSTCYGIVKQSEGHISVYTEVGMGTNFKVYLPTVSPSAEAPLPSRVAPGLPQGTETILLVEDDPALREMAATLLKRLGYSILVAGHGLEALSLIEEHNHRRIDLLFTDVVMPQMSGKELADRVWAIDPRTQILFTSAYTENAIAHQGVLDAGVTLLQKPFTPAALARKVREILDRREDSQARL